jgi:hypothetical protein
MSTAIAIIVSAIIGAVAALLVVSVHRAGAKMQKAVDILLKLRTDESFLSNQHKFREYASSADSKEKFARIIDPKTEGDLDDKLAIQNFLNTYELICVSIRQQVIDEKICKDLIGDSLKRRWSDAKELIMEIRRLDENNTYFTELQFVAETWENDGNCVRAHNIIATICEAIMPRK